MATTIRDKRNKCYICGEKIQNNEKVFIVQRGDVFRKHGNPDEEFIDIRKDPSIKFLVHAKCQNKLLWKQDHPDLELEQEYYAYLHLGWKDNKIVWKIGSCVLKNNATQQDVDKAIAFFAKDLLIK